MKDRKRFKIFFDRASKGIPGVVGGGGIIICPEGNNELEYYWNIGIDTNNMVEAYGLWQGLKQLENLGIDEAIVIGDSRLIIQEMNGTSNSKSLRLSRLIARIQSISRSSRHLEFVHVLRELNFKAYQATNKVTTIQINELYVNNHVFPVLPP